MNKDISHQPLRKQISNKARIIRAKLALMYEASEIKEKESIEPRDMYNCKQQVIYYSCNYSKFLKGKQNQQLENNT
jgi:hypothetical protein